MSNPKRDIGSDIGSGTSQNSQDLWLPIDQFMRRYHRGTSRAIPNSHLRTGAGAGENLAPRAEHPSADGGAHAAARERARARARPSLIDEWRERLGAAGVEQLRFEWQEQDYRWKVTIMTAGGRMFSFEASADPEVLLPAIERAMAKERGTDQRVGKALGFRSWHLEGMTLRPANMTYASWRLDGPVEAVCERANLYGAGGVYAQARGGRYACPGPPALDHDCGLHALHAPELMRRWHGHDSHMLHGAVRGWGRMQVYEEGWRAQWAEVVLLVVNRELQSRDHVKRAYALGAEFEVPVVEWPEFEDEARRFAEPVPLDLRPAPWRSL